MRTCARRLLRAPLLHSLALGLAGAWMLGAVTPRPAAVASVDEALYREALARGYQDLPAVRERLARLATFLELAPADADPETRRLAAVALRLDESDRVVRRYMIEAVRGSLAAELGVPAPTQPEVAAFHRAHRADFREPRRIRIAHVYVGGLTDASAERAAALAHRVESESPEPATAVAWGDAFYGGHALPPLDRAGLAARLGESFADAAMALPPGRWSGPIRSSYGHHVVRVEAVEPARDPDLAEVAPRIRRALTSRNREAALEERIAALRRRHAGGA